MTDQERKGAELPPETVAALIHTAQRRQKNGDRAGARALLRVLSAQQPDEPRVWLALAAVAETRAEQRLALERVIALDPQHPLAQRGLRRFQEEAPAPEVAPGRPAADRVTPVLVDEGAQADTLPAAPEAPAAYADETISAAPALTPVEPYIPARGIRWPLYVVIGVAVLAVLVVAGLLQLPRAGPDEQPSPTPPLLGVGQLPPLPATEGAAPPATAVEPATVAAPTIAGLAPASSAVPPNPTSAPTELPTAVPLPSPTAEVRLEPGTMLAIRSWHAGLLRPEHAVLLDGSIGALQPRGRFVLALVAVSNDGAAPARIPPDLFTLVDSRGNRYLPQPATSTAYLNTYGRGQRGDLSMEENIPPGGGIYSVPLIFDVSGSARGLTLHVDDAPLGWAISDAPAPAAPTAAPTP